MDATSKELLKVKEWLGEADAVILGIGPGLSKAGGVDLSDPDLMEKWMPDLKERGVETVLKGMRVYHWFDPEDPLEYWAFWSNLIKNLRYETEPMEVYKEVFDLVKDKPYFVISTTVDGQVEKAGFDMDRVYMPQGDMAYSQCYEPCNNERYYNEKEVFRMSSHIHEDGNVREDILGRCPSCGKYLVPNIRMEENFVAEPYLKQRKDFVDFVENRRDQNLLFLEFGEGFNQAGFIRYPFETMVETLDKARLVRFNTSDPEVPESIKDKALGIKDPIEKCLRDLI